MTDQNQDRLHELLFGDADRELVDFKVFPGRDPSVTEQDMRAEAARSIEASLADTISQPPVSGRSKAPLEA